MKRVAKLWAIIFLVALAVAVIGFPIAWYFDKDGEIVAWLTKNLTLNPMTVTVILAFLAWSVFEAWRSYTEQPTGEADQLHQDGAQVVKRSWPGGRPSYPENEWANKQINELGRKPDEVYPEWLKMAGERVKTLDSTPKEVFKKAIKPK